MAKKATKRVNKKAQGGVPCAEQLRKQLGVRFTDEEYAWVVSTAKSEGRPAANFVRHRILQGKETKS